MGLFRKKDKIQDSSPTSQFAQLYLVKLLFEDVIEERTALLEEKVIECFKDVEPIKKIKGLASFALPEYKVMYGPHQEIPSQLICLPLQSFEQAIITDQILDESWTCDNPRELLGRCNHMIIVGDMMAADLNRLDRCTLLARYIDILLEVYPECIALYWENAEKFMPKDEYQETIWEKQEYHFLDGGLNVRFFNVLDSEDMVVDTTGLCAIGLSDIQCRFTNLNEDAVMKLVNVVAANLFINGDVFKDGDEIDGIEVNEKWTCQHEISIVEPKRKVLNINTWK